MVDDKPAYTLVGLPLSLYSGKARSYLKHKRIPYIERGSSPWEFSVTFKRRVNAAAVPVVITPQGEYLADTSCIIDDLEKRFPERPALPASPVLRMASYLFELWGDEFWLPLAMHTRWSHREENVDLFIHDLGEFMLKGYPRWMKNALGRHYADLMNSYIEGLGVNSKTRPLLDRFLQIQLDGLDAHFREHRFLFGNRPSLGDYGMIAPLYAHIGRDPWSKRELIDPRPHLKAWIDRMNDANSSIDGEFQAEDTLPVTLCPAVRSIFDEMLPFVQTCADAVQESPVLSATTREAPRWFGNVRYPFAAGIHERKAVSYVVWMAQRMLDVFAAMPPLDQQTVRAWLREVGGEALLELKLPRVERVGLAAARINQFDQDPDIERNS